MCLLDEISNLLLKSVVAPTISQVIYPRRLHIGAL